MMGGYMQGRQRNLFSEFAGNMDPEATAMQIVSSALQAGLPPQVAIGLGGLQNRTQPGVGVLPGWWSQATPQQRQGYVRRQTTQNQFGVLPAWLEGDTPEETKENVRQYRQQRLEGTEDVPLSPSATEAYGEAMDTRIKKVDRFRPGMKDFDEKELFKEWQKFTGMYKFKNDTQRRAVLNVWKNKIGNLGDEVEWDPDDPKWAEAIGLKPETGRSARKAESTAEPVNQAAFEDIVRSMKDPEERQKYYDKWKSKWPDEYE
jgi:hypothetical protein